MAAPAEVSISNPYSDLSIPKINRLGTDALKDCVILELQGRELWDDPELQWAIDFSMDLHAGEMRKDGRYENHILRAALWCIREFDSRDPELAKVILLHDVVENHHDEVIAELAGDKAGLIGETIREQAVDALRKSGALYLPTTVDAIGNLTCPSFKDCTTTQKRQGYATHTLEHVMPDPLALAAKTADKIDNGNGNKYNPDKKMCRRLDTKYYPLHDTFIRSVDTPTSLIPPHRRELVIKALENGKEEATKRLMTARKHIPALTHEEVEALTLENLFAQREAA